MRMLGQRWAWSCSASLCLGMAAYSEEPRPVAQAPAAEAVSTEPSRLNADSKVSALGVQPTDAAEFWSRLERAEAQIGELQAQNQALRESQSQSILQTGYNPLLHMAPLLSAHDPEIGIIREQTSSTSLMELPKDPSKEAPKPKKWYDKVSFRGYAQFRLNEEVHRDEGSATAQYVGDRSVADNQNFLIRRARIIFSGDVHESVYIYLQTDFASTVNSADNNNHFAQIRDWYADFYLDDEKEYRFRVGQSKVPYGWENLQSSSNRIPLDRADAFNSAVRNERDLGVFFYYTPKWAQEFFKDVLEQGFKGSGNYGLLGFGAHNGQGGSIVERNDDVHFVARLTVPYTFENCQRMEVGIQGYTGEYTVGGAGYNGLARPTGTIGAPVTPNALDGWNDQRLGASFIWYPQPFGFQTEWTVGRGPALNIAENALEERALYGGYAMLLYKIDECYGTWFPFVRYSYFKGGYKSETNAPYVNIDEWEFGTEWQINSAAELTASYLITDRTNTTAMGANSYQQFDGHVLRFQFQVNY